jgi:hypothetical protein
MNKVKSGRVSIRIPIGVLDFIKKDVENSEEYFSMSEWIVFACRKYEYERLDTYSRRK